MDGEGGSVSFTCGAGAAVHDAVHDVDLDDRGEVGRWSNNGASITALSDDPDGTLEFKRTGGVSTVWGVAESDDDSEK